ncbi:hypothetical protein QJS10_CPB19g00191 [Acorus calamus]|uniref:Uncharacterized protein n=1 Tax=Acorus calamus TaxID=4465 RepID=A0AAV9CDY5_ACOCL|nr:hypothetical protein QJS10_CPB19g00191 [Acorus calamus]
MVTTTTRRRQGWPLWASSTGVVEEQFGYMVGGFGWGVRRMVEDGEEMRRVAHVQAEAFHSPVGFFNDFFFQFFECV